MTLEFEYEVEHQGSNYIVFGSADVSLKKEECTSEAGEQLVTEVWYSHQVEDFWIDEIEDVETEEQIEEDYLIWEKVRDMLKDDQGFCEIL